MGDRFCSHSLDRILMATFSVIGPSVDRKLRFLLEVLGRGGVAWVMNVLYLQNDCWIQRSTSMMEVQNHK